MNSFAIGLLVVVFAYYAVVHLIPALRRKIRGKNAVFVLPRDLEKNMKSKDLLIIDIRGKNEFYGLFGHIDGAINLPCAELKLRLAETADRLAGFKQTAVVVVGLRDEKAVYDAYDALKQSGFADVALLDKGLAGWVRAGLPTVERNVKKV
ncbi:MAG TPA: hypothetical protein DD624_05450 [Alphaproteobacteria bacterium]|nr:hypothetical protein [Alphaproteobacteria bacterium]